jgi:cardiolipin synthase
VRVFDVGKKDGPEVVSDRVMTVPNLLSFVRLLALPWIFVDLTAEPPRLTRAFVVLVVFAATDWFDGYLARRLDQVSRLGKLLDPISDRLLMVVVGIGMVLAGLVPLWAVVILLVRDVLVLGGAMYLLSRGLQAPAVTRIGKAATFGLMFAFPAFILAAVLGDGVDDPQPVVQAVAWFSYVTNTALYYIAAGQYVVDARRQLAARRSDAVR